MSTTELHRYRLRLRPEVARALHHAAVERGVPAPKVIAEAVEELVAREGWLAEHVEADVARTPEPPPQGPAHE
jgi:predicted transcriptional regulator